MKKTVAFLALALLVVSELASPADEPPHLQFVQGLRDRRMPDYALKYLEILSQNPPADLKALLPLELAKTRVELAALESDPARRSALFDQARNEFDTFVKTNPGHPLATGANLEIARIIALRGKAQLSFARRQETPAAEEAESAKARELFVEAAQRLGEAAKLIEAQLQKLDNPKTNQEKAAKKTLTHALFQAEYELALNLLDQAQTLSDLLQRSEPIQQAYDRLKVLAARDLKNPICWQARAWAGRSLQAIDKAEEAKKEYAIILAENGPHAEAAHRLVRHFQMRLARDEKTTDKKTTPTAEVVRIGEDWLKRYSGHLNTPEGFAVRFELAQAYEKQAKAMAKGSTGAPTQATLDLYGKAEKLYESLEQSENDYTVKARQNLGQIVLLTGASASGGDIEGYTNFKDCFKRAQYEAAMIDDGWRKLYAEEDKVRKKNPKDLEKEIKALEKKAEDDRKLRYTRIIQALNKALALNDPKANPQSLGDAHSMLAYVYMATNEPHRAAIVGEHLARKFPKVAKAPTTAGYALQAYAQVLFKSEKDLEQAKTDNSKGEYAKVMEQAVAADRERLRHLAEYMEKTWPTDPATDLARYQIGSQLLREKKFPEGIAVLNRVSPGYSDLAQARSELAWASLEIAKGKDVKEADKKKLQDQALKALETIPDIPNSVDPYTAANYVRAKLFLMYLLSQDKKYEQIAKHVQGLAAKFPKLRITDDKVRQELDDSIKSMSMLGQYGQASAAINAGDFDKARKLTDQAVQDIEGDKGGDERSASLRRALVLINLRANVQVGDMKTAQKRLELLQKTADDTILNQLVSEMGEQIESLKKQGDKAREQLLKTQNNFAAFLDLIAAQAKKQKMTPETVWFLANSYSSLSQHKRAVELLDANKIPDPGEYKEKEPKLDVGDDKDEEKVAEFQKKKEAYDKKLLDHRKKKGLYMAAQVLYCKELRLGAGELQGEERDNAFKKAFNGIIAILNSPQGKNYPSAKRERVQILEDWEKYGGKEGAIVGWNELMQSIKPPFKDNQQEEQYYEFYYHLTYCYFKNALKMPDEKKKQEAIKKAAGFITKLETNKANLGSDQLKQKYIDLLRKEPLLMEAYKESGGKGLL